MKYMKQLFNRTKIMSYNFEKQTCDICGITKKERDKLPPLHVNINHPEYQWTKSFKLGYNGEVWCPECHKEKKLELLFKIMDEREKRIKSCSKK